MAFCRNFLTVALLSLCALGKADDSASLRRCLTLLQDVSFRHLDVDGRKSVAKALLAFVAKEIELHKKGVETNLF